MTATDNGRQIPEKCPEHGAVVQRLDDHDDRLDKADKERSDMEDRMNNMWRRGQVITVNILVASCASLATAVVMLATMGGG